MSGQGWGAYQASELPVAHCIEVDLKIMCNFLRPLSLVLVDALCLCVEALSELIKIRVCLSNPSLGVLVKAVCFLWNPRTL